MKMNFNYSFGDKHDLFGGFDFHAIKLKKIDSRPWEKVYLMTIDGNEAGLIKKHDRTSKLDEFPWQAYVFTGTRADANHPEGFAYDSEGLGSWYHDEAPEDGRIGAIEALIDAHFTKGMGNRMGG